MTREYELDMQVRNAGRIRERTSADSEFNARRAAEIRYGRDNIRIFDGHQVRGSDTPSPSRPNS